MIHIPIPAPPELEEAVGYQGNGQLFALYWQPCGDEAVYDDGRSSGTGNWDGFLALVDHPAVRPHLGELRHALGSSDQDATHWLLLDRKQRRLFVLDEGQAARLLGEQWLEGRVKEVGAGACESLRRLLDLSSWQEVRVSNEEVQRRWRRRQEVIRRMVLYLDGFVQ
jgi:hypothetical protein